MATGSGDSFDYLFILHVDAFPREAGGAIAGWVVPDAARAQVPAIDASHDTLRTIPDPGGYLKFRGIPEGTYELPFLPDAATGFGQYRTTDISVTPGQVFTADTVTLYR